MRGLFVTGTDTGVGKTVLSAALMLRYPDACYWKPIQTGPTTTPRKSGGSRAAGCSMRAFACPILCRRTWPHGGRE